MKQHLNDAKKKKKKPTAKTKKLLDGGGLFLYVEPNGSKRWRYRYQFEGKEQLLSLGVYPDVKLKQARMERDRLKELILQGINPSVQRKAEKEAKKAEKERMKTIYCKQRNMLYRAAVLSLQKNIRA